VVGALSVSVAIAALLTQMDRGERRVRVERREAAGTSPPRSVESREAGIEGITVLGCDNLAVGAVSAYFHNGRVRGRVMRVDGPLLRVPQDATVIEFFDADANVGSGALTVRLGRQQRQVRLPEERTLRVRVIDGRGGPVPGVAIAAYPRRVGETEGAPPFHARGASDSSGDVLLGRLGACCYHIVASSCRM
jgi:hypothetical protein